MPARLSEIDLLAQSTRVRVHTFRFQVGRDFIFVSEIIFGFIHFENGSDVNRRRELRIILSNERKVPSNMFLIDDCYCLRSGLFTHFGFHLLLNTINELLIITIVNENLRNARKSLMEQQIIRSNFIVFRGIGSISISTRSWIPWACYPLGGTNRYWSKIKCCYMLRIKVL